MTRWDFMRPETIRNDTGGVQLERLRIVASSRFGVYLHRIRQADIQRDPHDHPWPFASLVLRGGYVEQVHSDEIRTHTRRRWSAHRMGTDQAHRILSVRPRTATLVLRGSRRPDWGFWTPDGWVGHREYEMAGVAS